MRLSLLLPVALALGATGCNENLYGPPHLDGPGPSPDITTHVAMGSEVSGQSRVTCVGPPADVAALGVLCGGNADIYGWTNAVGNMSFFAGDTHAGPKLLVYGYFDHPEDYSNRAADIRYSAYLVRESYAITDAEDWWTELVLASWHHGEALVSDVATLEASPVACTTSFVGTATLLAGAVTISVEFALVVPC